MSETRSVKLLRTILGVHLPWPGARLDFLARFILAWLQVRSVNLARLAAALSQRAKTSSNAIRLQRFFRRFAIDQADRARTVGSRLPKDAAWVLTLDRTNWKLGRTEINLLVLGVAYRGLTIPLFWTALPKAGHSSTAERMVLLKRWRETFPCQRVAYLLADREFVGRAGFGDLFQQRRPFRLRLKADAQLTSTRGRYPLRREFQDLRVGQTRVLRQARRLWGHAVLLRAKRLEDGEWLLLASDACARHAGAEYAERWATETLFAALKTHGFHLEDTHLTPPERVERRLARLTLAAVRAVQVGLWGHAQPPIRPKKPCQDGHSASSGTDSTPFNAWSPSCPEAPPNVSVCWDFCSTGDPSRQAVT